MHPVLGGCSSTARIEARTCRCSSGASTRLCGPPGITPVVYLLELDAVGFFVMHGATPFARRPGRTCSATRSTRWRALPHAIAVYIEGGYSDANSPQYAAQFSMPADVARVQGFTTNDTHNNWTINEIGYGESDLKAHARRPLHRQHGRERQRPQAQPTPHHPRHRGSLQRPGTRPRSTRHDHNRLPERRRSSLDPTSRATAAGACNGGPAIRHVLARARDRTRRAGQTPASARTSPASPTDSLRSSRPK